MCQVDEHAVSEKICSRGIKREKQGWLGGNRPQPGQACGAAVQARVRDMIVSNEIFFRPLFLLSHLSADGYTCFELLHNNASGK